MQPKRNRRRLAPGQQQVATGNQQQQAANKQARNKQTRDKQHTALPHLPSRHPVLLPSHLCAQCDQIAAAAAWHPTLLHYGKDTEPSSRLHC
jgi:hypothetical protein